MRITHYRKVTGFFGLGISYNPVGHQWYIDIGPWVIVINDSQDEDEEE